LAVYKFSVNLKNLVFKVLLGLSATYPKLDL